MRGYVYCRGEAVANSSRCLLRSSNTRGVLRTPAASAALALGVRPGCLLYLVALLHLPFFFRFVVLV
jgi:hypothetical protein